MQRTKSKTSHETILVKLKYGYIKGSKAAQICNYL